MIVLFPGRFQPLHKGHEKVIRSLLKKYEKVVIAIGSINQPRSRKNPFTYRERKFMFELVFKKAIKQNKLKIIGVKDYSNDEKWANVLLSRAKFDVVVTGNPWTMKCFKDKKKVLKVKFYKRKIYQSKIIRSLMAKGNSRWKKLVNPKLVEYISTILIKGYFEVLKEWNG